LVEVLSATDHPGVRNHAASALSDMRIPEVFGAILDLLAEPPFIRPLLTWFDL
jgi:hypothetical protein